MTTLKTHGAQASLITPEQALRRSVLTCMLWENTAYASGDSVVERIKELVPQCPTEVVANIAIEAREKQKLRHVPLLLVREMARHKTHRQLVGATLGQVVQRADEIGEFLNLYWTPKKQPLAHQVKKGLRTAFNKFNEFQFAKYNSASAAVKLRDALFMVCPKPKDAEQAKIFDKIANNTLETPDTWEVALSATGGKDKKQEWERLLKERKLGALALIRNLRNITQAGVRDDLLLEAMSEIKTDRVLPFRFITAARCVPQLKEQLEALMLRCLANHPQLPGRSVLIVDVSGSMGGRLSGKSELNRLDAAACIAMLLREICEDVVIYATGGNDGTRKHATALVENKRGFALADAIQTAMYKLGGGGIFLSQVMDFTSKLELSKGIPARTIVLTDEQDCDTKLSPDKANAYGVNNYIVNIANERHGVAYNKFTHVNGFSEAVVSFITQLETGVSDTQSEDAESLVEEQ